MLARTVAALVVAALAVGCGGEGDDDGDEDDAADTTTTTSDPDADAVDVCALVSGDEISDALGAPFDDGRSQTPLGGALGQCDFAAESISDAPVGTVGVFALSPEHYEDTIAGLGELRPVEDFGAEANHTEAGLLVRLQPFTLLVSAVAAGGDTDQEEAAEEAVAEIVMANL